MSEKKDLIVDRTYTKGDQRLSLFVREVSGGEIDGRVFQLEIWKNNIEDLSLREQSGDLYHMRRLYAMKLLNLGDDGWKKMNAGVCANPNSKSFNPEDW